MSINFRITRAMVFLFLFQFFISVNPAFAAWDFWNKNPKKTETAVKNEAPALEIPPATTSAPETVSDTKNIETTQEVEPMEVGGGGSAVSRPQIFSPVPRPVVNPVIRVERPVTGLGLSPIVRPPQIVRVERPVTNPNVNIAKAPERPVSAPQNPNRR